MKKIIMLLSIVTVLFFSACTKGSTYSESSPSVLGQKDELFYSGSIADNTPTNEETVLQNMTELDEYEQLYVEADNLFCQGNYESAGQLFYKLGDYKDALEKAKLCENTYLYNIGCSAQSAGEYDLAYQYFVVVGDFLDSEEKLVQCKEKLREEVIYIGPYLMVLNSYTSDLGTELLLAPTALVNIDRVSYAGIEGTVEYILVGEGDMMMTWISNQECGQEELIAARDLLQNDFWNSDYIVDFDLEHGIYYYWTKVRDYDTVLCAMINNHLKVTWVRPVNSIGSSKSGTTTSKKYCEDCDKEATKELEIFGQTSFLCDYHYDECMEIIDMMESDVGSGAYSVHHCEECSKEGTRSIIGILGQVEYYCTEHYNEIIEQWEDLHD